MSGIKAVFENELDTKNELPKNSMGNCALYYLIEKQNETR